jgi:hypothetical protein
MGLGRETRRFWKYEPRMDTKLERIFEGVLFGSFLVLNREGPNGIQNLCS